MEARPVSGIRTFLLVGLAAVWLGEGVFTGVAPLAARWTTFWKMFVPDDPTLGAALLVTHAFEAPLKAGLLVLALFALWSRDPSVRTPLFISMSIVPPINIAFHFRAQGFPLVSMTIATTLSVILWGAFLLTEERAEPSPQEVVGRQNVRWRSWYAWAAVTLTCLGLLFLLRPMTALYWFFPCLNSTFDIHKDQLSSLTVSILAAGSHLTALAAATWFATARYETAPALQPALALSGITVAGLMCVLPLPQLIRLGGWSCARSPVHLSFVLLLIGWLAYGTFNRTRGDT